MPVVTEKKAGPTPEEVSRALLAAVELMNDTGRHWIRGHFRARNADGETAYCAIGGIREVTKGNAQLRKAVYRALNKAIRKGYAQHRISAIMYWNDTSRSWNEVKAGFQRAAKEVLK